MEGGERGRGRAREGEKRHIKIGKLKASTVEKCNCI